MLFIEMKQFKKSQQKIVREKRTANENVYQT